MQSIRRIKQEKKFSKIIKGNKMIIVSLRFDDRCGNGHNTFSITGEIVDSKGRFECGGCIHEEIRKYFPEYAHLIPYHLCTTDGPTYYIENTIYHASCISEKQDKWYFYLENHCIRIIDLKERDEMISRYGANAVFKDFPNPMAKKPNLEYARSSAIWPDASLEQLKDKEQLEKRLPSLIEDFRNKMLELGFEW